MIRNIFTDPNDPIVFTKDFFMTGEHFPLTKREYFAAMAMQGILANSGIHAMAVKNDPGKEQLVKLHCLMAIDHADALIAQLNKTQSEGA